MMQRRGCIMKRPFRSPGGLPELCRKRKIMEGTVFKNQIPGDEKVSVLLYGNVGDGQKVDSGRVVAELMELAAAYGRIDVHINSKGGDVFSGIAIRNALQSSQADITIHVDGLAASIAAVIALCGRPLYMNRYARLMLHRVSGGTWGNADELRRAASLAEEVEGSLAEIISGRCRMEPGEVRKRWFDGTDHWLNAQQAMGLGLIDGITESGQTIEASASDEDIYQFTNRLLEEPQKTTDMAFIDDLKKRPSFANMRTEQEMLGHIASLENQAAKVPALEERVNTLTEQMNRTKKDGCAAFLNQAVAEGRLTAEQVPAFLNLMMSDEENTRKAVESLPKRGSVKVEDFLAGGAPSGTAADLANMSWDDIDRAERLPELKAKYPELYRKKFDEKFRN